MKRLTSWISLIVVACCISGAAFAHGNVSCDVPKNEWRPRVDLQKVLKAKGWTIRDIKIENGCYEVYGFDAESAKVEAFFNPKTFERIHPGDSKPVAHKE